MKTEIIRIENMKRIITKNYPHLDKITLYNCIIHMNEGYLLAVTSTVNSLKNNNAEIKHYTLEDIKKIVKEKNEDEKIDERLTNLYHEVMVQGYLKCLTEITNNLKLV